MKISSFMIALILIGVVVTTFTMMIVDLTTSYGVEYDQSTLAVFNETGELHTLAAQLENKTTGQNVESGVLDIVGAYIGRALDTLKLSVTSLSVFDRMASQATNKVGLPSYFLTAFISIMLILIIIGVIVSAMVKKDL